MNDDFHHVFIVVILSNVFSFFFLRKMASNIGILLNVWILTSFQFVSKMKYIYKRYENYLSVGPILVNIYKTCGQH